MFNPRSPFLADKQVLRDKFQIDFRIDLNPLSAIKLTSQTKEHLSDIRPEQTLTLSVLSFSAFLTN